MLRDYWRRSIISSVLTIPLLIISPPIQSWLGFALSFPGDLIALLGLASAIYVYGGYPFLKGLYSEVSTNKLGMMTLVGTALSVA